MNDGSVERVFATPELAMIVASYLGDEFDVNGDRDLVNLSCVNRRWFYICTPRLWSQALPIRQMLRLGNVLATLSPLDASNEWRVLQYMRFVSGLRITPSDFDAIWTCSVEYAHLQRISLSGSGDAINVQVLKSMLKSPVLAEVGFDKADGPWVDKVCGLLAKLNRSGIHGFVSQESNTDLAKFTNQPAFSSVTFCTMLQSGFDVNTTDAFANLLTNNNKLEVLKVYCMPTSVHIYSQENPLVIDPPLPEGTNSMLKGLVLANPLRNEQGQGEEFLAKLTGLTRLGLRGLADPDQSPGELPTLTQLPNLNEVCLFSLRQSARFAALLQSAVNLAKLIVQTTFDGLARFTPTLEHAPNLRSLMVSLTHYAVLDVRVLSDLVRTLPNLENLTVLQGESHGRPPSLSEIYFRTDRARDTLISTPNKLRYLGPCVWLGDRFDRRDGCICQLIAKLFPQLESLVCFSCFVGTVEEKYGRDNAIVAGENYDNEMVKLMDEASLLPEVKEQIEFYYLDCYI